MIRRIRQWLCGKDGRDECKRLHGESGTYVRLPSSLRDLNNGYKALIRELGKR